MLNITRKLVLFTLCGGLLAAASNASHASNVYGAAASQTDEAATTTSASRYWACPAEYRICPSEAHTVTAKAGDQGSRTDVPVFDTPEHPASPLEESRYYDYNSMILGD